MATSYENSRVKRWGPGGYDGPYGGGRFPGRGFPRRAFPGRNFPGGGFSGGGFPRGGFPVGGGGAFPGAGLLSSFASEIGLSANLRIGGFNNLFIGG